MEGYSLQFVAESPTNPGWSVEMNESGAVFRSYEIGDMEHIGISAEDGLEAVLTARPAIIKPGDQDAWRKKSWANSWRDYVERTGIIPPDDVTALLIPEAQNAIHNAAYQRRRTILEAYRTEVTAAMSTLKVGKRQAHDQSLEEWLTLVKQGLTEIRHDIDTFQSREPRPTTDQQEAIRTCAFVCALALFACGDFEAAKDIVDNVHSTPTPAMRRLAHVVPLLLPPVRQIDPICSSAELSKWLSSQRAEWIWYEALACYESVASDASG